MASGFFNPYMKWTINKPCLKPPTSNGKRLHNELENRPMLFMRKKKKKLFRLGHFISSLFVVVDQARYPYKHGDIFFPS